MTEREFCYWLQGLFEVGKPETLNAEQTEMIRKHLGLVFDRVINMAARPVTPVPDYQKMLREGVVGVAGGPGAGIGGVARC